MLNKFKFSLPPLPTPPPVHAPDRATQLQLALVILIVVIAHFIIAKPIIALFALLIWTFKTGLIYRRFANPPQWVVMLFTILSLLMILIFYGGWNGQKAGISFLVLLLSLKFLESTKLRDYYVVCLILFFVASSSFLFNSSLPSVVMVIGYVVVVTALLLKISNPTASSFSSTLGMAVSIMLKALPMAIILFFFFPRVQGNFGFIPSQDELNSDNRLSNSLIAGDFVSSAFNNSPAFRVEFDGAFPDNSQLYWRAKVMSEEQNFQWLVKPLSLEQRRRAQLRQRPTQTNQATISYEIVHQDSSDSFAPFLDYVLNQSIGTQLDDHSVYLSKKTEGVFAYRGRSTAKPNLPFAGKLDVGPLLATSSNPKTRTEASRTEALIHHWRRSTSNDQELINTVLRYFTDNEFYYSLDPPSLGNDPLDEFLFDSKTGYCGHYASTFTILMRRLGIPARVVVGYQGGVKNGVGNYLEVRYSDAHAWSEVWLNDQWQRVDPTAAISPERIQYGMDALMDLWLNDSLGGNATGRALANFLNPSGYQKAYRRLRDSWDNVGHQWNKWVVNYDFDAQRSLLENLGLKHKNSIYILIALVCVGTLLLLLFYFWQLIPKPIRIGEAQHIYLKFVHGFKRHKLEKALSDTPNEFAQKARQRFPSQAQEINAITNSYQQIRYGRNPGQGDSGGNELKLLDSFKQQVKRFKLH